MTTATAKKVAPAKVATSPEKTPRTKRVTVKSEPSNPATDYLRNLIPQPEVAQRYVSRYIDTVLDLDILSKAQKRGKNVLIFGDTGSGKTMFVRAYAATTGQPFVNMAGEGSATPDDFLGGPAIDVVTGQLRWIDGPTLMAVLYGAVLNMDEVNFFKGKVTAVTHGLLDERGVLTMNKHPFHWMSSKTGMYFINKEDATSLHDVADIPVNGSAYIVRSPKLLVVATYNPDYADTSPLNEAFANRFGIKLAWDYDADVEANLIDSVKLREMARKLREAKKTGVINTPVSTNMLMTFEEFACDDDLTFSFAQSNFINNFPADERSAVMEIFKLFRDGLMAEYGWAAN